ncbi:helix-turn-helix domain-containing protein [Enterococcus sp.]|uniref:helix-turn-helix domain-containing protein n=1 Tax=Enterococcus sp. TaxID=35783 RepID=UPI0029069E78|nr:helix-turn-helix domain-containing protein [Enterococcus sp.]MDU5335446.1 helix-turn-helix domain-containing protein [Enterococcus sp.]
MLSLEKFLDKDAKRKFEFLRLLEESGDLTELNTVIQDRLKLSSFLFSKTIEELTTDVSNYGLEKFFSIKNDSVQTTLLEVGQATSDLLLELYLRDSLSFKIFLALFEENFQSTHSFALDQYTSYTSVYNRMQQLKQFFKEASIAMNKKYQLTGDEANVRYVLTRVFSFVLSSDDSLYSDEIKQQIEVVLTELTTAGMQFPRNLRTKLRHFLAISLVRQEQGHLLTEFNENKQKVLKQLKTIYSEDFAQIEQLGLEKHLAEELFSYLYTNGVLAPTAIADQFLGKRISRLNEHFLTRIAQNFEMDSAELKRVLWPELSRLHFELVYFPLNAFYSFERFDVSFFEESYVEYFNFCREYLRDEAFVKEEGLFDYRPYIFYRYLMILVGNLDLEQVMPKLTICIDFSFGQEYNAFIKKNLSFFVNLNVATQYIYDDQADLVITNLNSEYAPLEVEKVIWLDPPRPTDWANLGNLLLKIRAEKHERLRSGNK